MLSRVISLEKKAILGHLPIKSPGREDLKNERSVSDGQESKEGFHLVHAIKSEPSDSSQPPINKRPVSRRCKRARKILNLTAAAGKEFANRPERSGGNVVDDETGNGNAVRKLPDAGKNRSPRKHVNRARIFQGDFPRSSFPI